MGGTSWSDSHYRDSASLRAKSGKKAFDYDHRVRTGATPKVAHADLDTKRLKAGKRESRDSEEHPVSNAVAVGFDVTGSMGLVPQILQKSLPTLMGLLLRKSFLTDPAVLIAGIGDATCDSVPLQVGQFESGIEIEKDLTNIYLEGGGGGGAHETYELFLYFLARHTELDCLEKRNKKGYAFIVGDEMPYSEVSRGHVKQFFDVDLQADIPIKDIVDEVKEKYTLFYIHPQQASYADDERISGIWKELLGQHYLKLEDSEGISELIASTIGISEGVADIDSLTTDLTSEGTSPEIADGVARSLVLVSESAEGAISLPNSGKGTGLTEL